MRRKSFHDYRQLEIPFDEAMWIIDTRKKEHEKRLIEATEYFKEHNEERAFLLKIIFDITDKDFEYFCEYLLKGYYKLNEYRVTGGWDDEGQDIYGKNKVGVEYSFQCKQWSTVKINPDSVGKYLGQTYKRRKDNPNTKFVYVTTSYFTPDSREFLRENNIEYMNNVKLVKIAGKLGLFDQEKWNRLIADINKARIHSLRIQMNPNPLRKLALQRGVEITHHFPSSMQREQMRVNGVII